MSTLHDECFPNLSPVWSRLFPIEVDHGSGSYIWTADGKRYLDFTCGIGVTNTGHCHPRIVEAIRRQAGAIIHAQANIMTHRPMLELVGELKRILPAALDGFFFSNSGAEAVEGALKLARAATGRQSVVVFTGSFHGRTSATMALTTSKNGYRGISQLMPSGVHVSPYPYPYRLGMDEEGSVRYALESLDDLFAGQVSPRDVAAILVEPVLGEGGYVQAPGAFLGALRELCDRHGILLVFDEIQSGFGRTGTWFAMEHSGIVPDILTVAKGIASGLPLSGVFSRMDLMRKWPTGSHGGTFGGNAVAMAAAVETIRIIEQEGLLSNARERGEQLRAGLANIALECPELAEIRGPGLMVGTEFSVDGSFRNAGSMVKRIVRAAFSRGLMLLTCGTYDSAVRWIPPLTASRTEIDEALGIFASAVEEVRSRPAPGGGGRA